ncbi:MAG: L,D-transpeptidase [Patescibacteria group bacterium]
MRKKLPKKSKLKSPFIIEQKSFIGIITLTLAVFFIVTLVVKQKNASTFCANSISCIKNLSGLYEKRPTSAEFLGKILEVPTELAQIPPPANVLGNTTEQKRIEINLSTQHLYAHEGNSLIYDFPVSTGKWFSTPTGSFRTWIKLRYTRMQGGSKAWGTYYNLPNVPYVMYFYNESTPKAKGYGIHGAYWHNNFGHPMSHGCVNMRIEDAELLYNWADPPTKTHTTYVDDNNHGTLVIIYGETPKG